MFKKYFIIKTIQFFKLLYLKKIIFNYIGNKFNFHGLFIMKNV
jgi:hypothetical protein